MGKGGLAFLNKKSWHTGKIKNHERVWQAEEHEREEKRKLSELRKEIEEERNEEELRALQEDAGLVTKRTRRMGWMEYGAKEERRKEKEEYLLGKELPVGAAVTKPEMKAEEANPADRWVKKYENRDLDAAARIREDPLLMMMSAEMQAREKIISNPLQMKQLREEVHGKRSRGHRESLRVSRSPRRRNRSIERSRDRSRDRYRHRDSRDRSVERSRDRYRRGDSRDRRDSRYYDDDRSRRRRRRSYTPERRRRRRSRSSHSRPSNNSHSRTSHSKSTQSNNATRENPFAEERARLLEEMMSSAKTHTQELTSRYKDDLETRRSEEVVHLKTSVTSSKKATFLRDVEEKSFLKSDDRMEDRLHRNRHYRQKGDVESQPFLSKR